MRDAAFTVYALLRLGFTEEAGAFLGWLEGRVRDAGDRESGPLQIMYGIDGREDLTWARRRCGSGTGRRPSCSSTSTAS
jgi:GH15 family glucan-1,4-alpha-glucosidase